MTSPSRRSSNPGEICRSVIHHTLEAINPFNLVTAQLQLRGNVLEIKGYPVYLDRYDRIHVFGAGKGAVPLYKGLRDILPSPIAGGIVVSLAEHAFGDKRVRFYPASHPIPDEKSLTAGRAVADYAERNIRENHLVFCLLTGGASAMLVLPAPGVTPADKIEMNRQLLSCGADIREINCVRKHLSALKGGRLAEMVSPTVVLSLLVSDIIDSPVEDIGSGPSVGDSTTFADARAILEKYRLWENAAPRIKERFLKGIANQIPDTPTPTAREFAGNRHFILGDNIAALEAARKKGELTGIPTHILTYRDRGEAAAYAREIANLVKKIVSRQSPYKPPVLLISGGELTVTLKGRGKGGRNQQFILDLLKELQEVKRPYHIASLGTDGIDGPTDAAGAWIDEKTIRKVQRLNLDIDDYLANNDSYHFFREIGQLIKTGPTATNVMDLRLIYIP